MKYHINKINNIILVFILLLLYLVETKNDSVSNKVFPYSEQINIYTGKLILFTIDHSECIDIAISSIMDKFNNNKNIKTIEIYRRVRVALVDKKKVSYISTTEYMRSKSGLFPILLGEIDDQMSKDCFFKYFDINNYEFVIDKKLPIELIKIFDNDLNKNTITFILFQGIWYIYEGKGHYSPIRIGENMQHRGIFSYSGINQSIHYIFVKQADREKSIIDNLGSHRKKKKLFDKDKLEKLRIEFISKRSLLNESEKANDEKYDMFSRQIVILRDKIERDVKQLFRYKNKDELSCSDCNDIFKCPSCNIEIFPSNSDIEFNSMVLLQQRGYWEEDMQIINVFHNNNQPFIEKMNIDNYNRNCLNKKLTNKKINDNLIQDYNELSSFKDIDVSEKSPLQGYKEFLNIKEDSIKNDMKLPNFKGDSVSEKEKSFMNLSEYQNNFENDNNSLDTSFKSKLKLDKNVNSKNLFVKENSKESINKVMGNKISQTNMNQLSTESRDSTKKKKNGVFILNSSDDKDMIKQNLINNSKESFQVNVDSSKVLKDKSYDNSDILTNKNPKYSKFSNSKSSRKFMNNKISPKNSSKNLSLINEYELLIDNSKKSTDKSLFKDKFDKEQSSVEFSISKSDDMENYFTNNSKIFNSEFKEIKNNSIEPFSESSFIFENSKPIKDNSLPESEYNFEQKSKLKDDIVQNSTFSEADSSKKLPKDKSKFKEFDESLTYSGNLENKSQIKPKPENLEKIFKENDTLSKSRNIKKSSISDQSLLKKSSLDIESSKNKEISLDNSENSEKNLVLFKDKSLSEFSKSKFEDKYEKANTFNSELERSKSKLKGESEISININPESSLVSDNTSENSFVSDKTKSSELSRSRSASTSDLESELESDSRSELESESKSELELKSRSGSISIPSSESVSRSALKSKLVSRSKPRSRSRSKSRSKPRSRSKSRSKSRSRLKSRSKLKSRSRFKSGSRSKSKSKMKLKSKSISESKKNSIKSEGTDSKYLRKEFDSVKSFNSVHTDDLIKSKSNSSKQIKNLISDKENKELFKSKYQDNSDKEITSDSSKAFKISFKNKNEESERSGGKIIDTSKKDFETINKQNITNFPEIESKKVTNLNLESNYLIPVTKVYSLENNNFENYIKNAIYNNIEKIRTLHLYDRNFTKEINKPLFWSINKFYFLENNEEFFLNYIQTLKNKVNNTSLEVGDNN